MFFSVLKIFLFPAIWLAYAVALHTFLWPYIEQIAPKEESLTWERFGLILLLVFTATLMTFFTLMRGPRKRREDEPYVFRAKDIQRQPPEGTQTIEVIRERPEVEKME